MDEIPKPKDWTDLRAVIEYVEKLGPGYTVFKDGGKPSYGVCPSSELPYSGRPTGQVVVRGGAVLGREQRRFIIYTTKDRR